MRASQLTVVMGPTVADHMSPGHRWASFVVEVLEHARIPYRRAETIPSQIHDVGLMLFACPPDATGQALVRLLDWVRRGGSLIAVGGPGTLSAATGVKAGAPIADGHVLVEPRYSADIDVPLHAFGGVELQAPDTGRVLANWETPSTEAAIVSVDVDDGLATIIGVDLWQTIVRILQGWPVEVDGRPAVDGSAPLDDGVLKCEDGIALSLELDRALPPGQPVLPDGQFRYEFPPAGAHRVFHRPQADLWRALLLRTIFEAADRARVAVPWLYYWPSLAPAVAHLSLDTDGNVAEHAESSLELLDALDVAATWCHLHPGGYGTELMGRIAASGHEHALHYDALGESDIAQWGQAHLREQHAWLEIVVGTERIVTNKNHYTRWEGWVEFYTWCEELGIKIDQSRGGSKLGTAGFPFGSAHVWFPVHEGSAERPFLDVLVMPFHTQDLALAAHESVRDLILDQAVAVHGLAHFLFHPMHLFEREYVRSACASVVAVARQRGIPWWTSEQVNEWERARRQVSLMLHGGADGSARLTIRATTAVPDATILVPSAGDADHRVDGPGGQPFLTSVFDCYGKRFLSITLDLPVGELELQIRDLAAPSP